MNWTCRCGRNLWGGVIWLIKIRKKGRVRELCCQKCARELRPDLEWK